MTKFIMRRYPLLSLLILGVMPLMAGATKYRPSISMTERRKLKCDQCRHAHIKCDGKYPCSPCCRKRFICHKSSRKRSAKEAFACISCHRLHRKCTGGTPCKECRTDKTPCERRRLGQHGTQGEKCVVRNAASTAIRKTAVLPENTMADVTTEAMYGQTEDAFSMSSSSLPFDIQDPVLSAFDQSY